MRTKENLLAKLERELRKFDRRYIIALSYSSDPYPVVERELGITRRVLKLLRHHKVRCLLLTKSDIFERDIDILSELHCAIGVTVTTIDKKKTKLLEPNAPSPKARIKALRKAKKAGIPVYARIDPIIPFYTWEDFDETLKALNFVDHITVSTLKLRPDSKRRMFIKFPELMERLWPLYEIGEKIGGYYYLPKELRLQILRDAERKIKELEITFGSCREGYHSFPSCDGSHLVP